MTLHVPVMIDVAVVRPGASGQAFVPTEAEAQSLGLTSGQPLTTQRLPVSDAMIVTLRSETAGAFTMNPDDSDPSVANAETKIIAPGNHGEWHWTVTPNLGGKQTLVLHSVFAMYMPDGSVQDSDQGSFETTITVQVLPWYTRAWQAVVSALFGNWTHIVGSIGAAALTTLLGVWVARRKNRSKNRRRHKPATGKPTE
jgi:hypothetical protein